MNVGSFFYLLLGASLANAVSVDEPAQRVFHQALTSHPTAAEKLNFSSATSHIFSSLRSLLQQWPNTFFPNGHSIVPCEVPAYTNLYHGRRDDQIAPDPEWLAFDIEMSYGIMGTRRNSHMLTYQSVQAVKCLSFDGMRAALMGSGQLDAQMAFSYGNTTGPPPGPGRPGFAVLDELARARGRCVSDTGEGPLNSLTSVFPLPSSTTRTPPPPVPTGFEPSQWAERERERERFLMSSVKEWFRSATWHYGSSGMGAGQAERWVQVLSCGFTSYYDAAFHSLASDRAASARQALNLSTDGRWQGPGLHGSGLLLHLVATPPPPSANRSIARTFVAQARSKSHDLVMPFMEYPRAPGSRSALACSARTLESPRGQQTFSQGTSSYTRLLYTAEGALRDDVGRLEKVLTEAIEEVLAAICSVIIQLGFEIEDEWLSRWNTPTATALSPPSASIIDPARVWQRQLEELMAWLGWAADEVRSEKLCSVDEHCYIPMWLLMFIGAGRPQRRPPRLPGNGTGPAPPNDGRPPYPSGSSPPDLRPPPSFPHFDEDRWSPRCMAILG